MKKLKYYSGLLAFTLVVNGCDKIDGPRREVDNSGTQLSENSIVIQGDTLTVDADSSTALQRVMLEEFTGHLCGTCPPAAKLLNDSLRPLFGDRLVVVGVHSGQFAEVCPTSIDCPSAAPSGAFTTDFRCTISDELTAQFGVTANPLGMVNRVGYPTSHKKTYLSWKTFMLSELAASPVVRMNSTVLYDASTRVLKAAVRSEMLSQYSGTLKLAMVLVEDSIVDWQQWYNHTPQYVPDYVHHDVLRTSLTGGLGEELVATSPIESGKKFLNGYFVTLNPDWDADKCKVVCYLYDETTFKVLQVIEEEIIK